MIQTKIPYGDTDKHYGKENSSHIRRWDRAEVTQQSIKVLNAVGQRFGHVFHYTEAIMGADAIDKRAIRCLMKP